VQIIAIAPPLEKFLPIMHKNASSFLDKGSTPNLGRDHTSRGVEWVMIRDDELPWIPPKRAKNREQQFSTFLVFERVGTHPRQNPCLSHWRSEKRWVDHYRSLSATHPDWETIDWLAHFVDCLQSDTTPPTEQQLALYHLWCFYQEDFYYLSRQLWMGKKLPHHLFSWQEIFDVVCEPLSDLDKARRSLRNFDPRHSYRRYTKQLFYHRSRDIFHRKLGTQQWQSLPVIFSLEKIDLKTQEEYAFHDLDEQEFERVKLNLEEKEQHKQVWETVKQRLEALEGDRHPAKKIPIPPTTLTLWEMMLMGYGLNIGQSGTVQILNYNHQPLLQSKLSRQLKTFKVELFLACSAIFAEEIVLQMGMEWIQDNPEQNLDFQNRAEQQHKSLDDILRQYYQDWIYEFVIKQDFDPMGVSTLDLWLINQLQAWFQTQLEIIFKLEALTPAMIKKMGQVLQAWAAELRA